jgi:hypothetical protein
MDRFLKLLETTLSTDSWSWYHVNIYGSSLYISRRFQFWKDLCSDYKLKNLILLKEKTKKIT